MYKFLELKKVNSKLQVIENIKRAYDVVNQDNNIIEIIKQNIEILKFLNLKSLILIIHLYISKLLTEYYNSLKNINDFSKTKKN